MSSAVKVVIAILVVVVGLVAGGRLFVWAPHDALSPKPTLPAVGHQEESTTESEPPPASILTHEPLPPAGKSFVETERSLGDRARAGDAEAATRLFHDAFLCYQARSAEETIERMADQGGLDPSDKELSSEPVSTLEIENRHLVRLQSALSTARKAGDLCKGTDHQITDGRMYWYARQAAKAGDARAASCFLIGGFTPPTFESDQSLSDDFKRNLVPMAEEQLRLGNVAMVTVLAVYYDNTIGIMSYVRPKTDLPKSYIYRKLNSLISVDETASDALEELHQASATLTPGEIEAGDAEAARLFEADFRRKEPIPASDELCN